MNALVLRLPLARDWCSDCGDMTWFDQVGCAARDRHLAPCSECGLRPTNGGRSCGTGPCGETT